MMEFRGGRTIEGLPNDDSRYPSLILGLAFKKLDCPNRISTFGTNVPTLIAA